MIRIVVEFEDLFILRLEHVFEVFGVTEMQ